MVRPMSRALESEFARLRSAAARIPEGCEAYSRARGVLANVRTITHAHETIAPSDAIALVRKARETVEELARSHATPGTIEARRMGEAPPDPATCGESEDPCND